MLAHAVMDIILAKIIFGPAYPSNKVKFELFFNIENVLNILPFATIYHYLRTAVIKNTEKKISLQRFWQKIYAWFQSDNCWKNKY